MQQHAAETLRPRERVQPELARLLQRKQTNSYNPCSSSDVLAARAHVQFLSKQAHAVSTQCLHSAHGALSALQKLTPRRRNSLQLPHAITFKLMHAACLHGLHASRLTCLSRSANSTCCFCLRMTVLCCMISACMSHTL